MTKIEELFDKIHQLESTYFMQKYTMNYFTYTREEIIKLLTEFSRPVEADVSVKNADIGKSFIIYSDEGNIVLSQEDILNHIDADLDIMDNEEEMSWTVLRKDMTEEEINNLPEM